MLPRVGPQSAFLPGREGVLPEPQPVNEGCTHLTVVLQDDFQNYGDGEPASVAACYL